MFIADLIATFQDLVAQVPELLQPFIVMLAAAVPFIEGEGASPIGVLGGINPVIAALFAIAGNFLSVLAVVTVSSRARELAVAHRNGRSPELTEAKPQSKGRERFGRWVVRFGVPGASILGPLAIPTQITSSILVASGTKKSWVLLWQAIAIVLWTILTTTVAWLAVSALGV